MEHLGELRTRLMWAIGAFLFFSIIAFIAYEPILEFFRKPYCGLPKEVLGPQGCDFPFTGPLGGFQFRLKLTALVGIGLSSPVWLYQLWAFVTPALTVRERRYAAPFLVSSILLFAIGVTLAYVTIPTGLRLLFTIGGDELFAFITADEYVNFIGLMLIAFGVTFEMPLVLIFLGLAGVVTVQQLRKQRRVALIAILALAAIVTPSQDPYTMLVLAVPLYALYELTILILARMMKRRARSDSSV